MPVQELDSIKMHSQGLFVYTHSQQILKDISLKIPKNKVTALIGPSGAGKSTYLRCLNKIIEMNSSFKVEGKIFLGNENIDDLDIVVLRSRVGMIFQRPNPFPFSIYENVAYGPRLHGLYQKKSELDEIVHNSLDQAGLWNEVKGDIHKSGFDLSVGQQQRLCIARALAVEPEVLLMDEPCSALDPTSTQRIEELLRWLSHQMTIVLVTHQMLQAKQVSHRTALLYAGELIEENQTEAFFNDPRQQRTKEYLLQ